MATMPAKTLNQRIQAAMSSMTFRSAEERRGVERLLTLIASGADLSQVTERRRAPSQPTQQVQRVGTPDQPILGLAGLTRPIQPQPQPQPQPQQRAAMLLRPTRADVEAAAHVLAPYSRTLSDPYEMCRIAANLAQFSRLS